MQKVIKKDNNMLDIKPKNKINLILVLLMLNSNVNAKLNLFEDNNQNAKEQNQSQLKSYGTIKLKNGVPLSRTSKQKIAHSNHEDSSKKLKSGLVEKQENQKSYKPKKFSDLSKTLKEYQEKIVILKQGKKADKYKIANHIIANQGNYPPIVLYSLAEYFLENKNYLEASLFYNYSQFRAEVDIELLNDTSSSDIPLLMLKRLKTAMDNYIPLTERGYFMNTYRYSLKEVIPWDLRTVRSYDLRWPLMMEPQKKVNNHLDYPSPSEVKKVSAKHYRILKQKAKTMDIDIPLIDKNGDFIDESTDYVNPSTISDPKIVIEKRRLNTALFGDFNKNIYMPLKSKTLFIKFDINDQLKLVIDKSQGEKIYQTYISKDKQLNTWDKQISIMSFKKNNIPANGLTMAFMKKRIKQSGGNLLNPTPAKVINIHGVKAYLAKSTFKSNTNGTKQSISLLTTQAKDKIYVLECSVKFKMDNIDYCDKFIDSYSLVEKK